MAALPPTVAAAQWRRSGPVFGQNAAYSDEHYVGITSDLEARLERHSGGHCPHSAKSRPWEIEIAIAFRSEQRALAFEKYLKSHSGRAFAKKHF